MKVLGLTSPPPCGCGAVAQLGERSVRNAEVVGSNPIGSTKDINRRPSGGVFLSLVSPMGSGLRVAAAVQTAANQKAGVPGIPPENDHAPDPHHDPMPSWSSAVHIAGTGTTTAAAAGNGGRYQRTATVVSGRGR